MTKGNRAMARFIYDMLLFHFCPYWTPAVVSAALFIAAFLFVSRYSLIYGGACVPCPFHEAV